MKRGVSGKKLPNVYVLLELVEKTSNIYIHWVFFSSTNSSMYYWSWWGCVCTNVLLGVCTHVLLELGNCQCVCITGVVYVLLELVEKTPNVYVLLVVLLEGGKNYNWKENTHVYNPCMYKCITGVGGKQHTSNVYVLHHVYGVVVCITGKKTTRCVCITGIGGKKHPNVYVLLELGVNTPCVCITGVGRKTPNVYVLLELVENTPKYVCITGVGRKTPKYVCITGRKKNTQCVCITGVGGRKKTPNVYVLLELEGKHPMCMYYWSWCM